MRLQPKPKSGLMFLILAALMAVLALAACSSTPRVSRVDTDTTIDVSGRWNDADSRMVAETMIGDCLNNPWLTSYVSSHQGKRPTVIVGTVVNRSHEHINTQTITKDLERSLINSGRVDFVASKDERQEIRDERKDQAVHAADDTVKGPGKEIGADFMLKGSINTIVDEAGGKRVVFYQVNLELIDMANNRKAWIGEKEIKKVIARSRVKP